MSINEIVLALYIIAICCFSLIFFMIYGYNCFRLGFSKLLKRRKIQNIPASKIRSVALGLVKIKGKARQKIPLRAPFSNINCCYYKYIVERYDSTISDWYTICEIISNEYFYIEDETGKILVDPSKADIILPIGYRTTENKWFNSIRHTEWFIPVGEKIYIIGTVKKYRDDIEERKKKLIEKLRDIKNNKENLMKFDLNKDGHISVEEWDNAIRKVEQQILNEELQQSAPEDDLVIGKGESESVFIISDHSEGALCLRLKLFGLLRMAIAIIISIFLIFIFTLFLCSLLNIRLFD